MNPFEPAQLSPLAQPPVPCRLPFGLTWADLRPALPGFDEARSEEAHAFAGYAKQGLNGGDNSVILTLRYLAADEQLRSQTAFVKRNSDPQKAEARKYVALAGQGIPTPRLFTSVVKGNVEIVVLEFLPTIGIEFGDSTEVLTLMRLLARLNSAAWHADLKILPAGEPSAEANDTFEQGLQAALLQAAQDRSLGGAFDPERCWAGYKRAQTASRAFPLAVTHGEFYFQQVGWAQRGLARELVVFDLETLGLRTRFTDLASVLYSLAAYTGREQTALLAVYLEALRQRTGQVMRLEAALLELRQTRVVELCESLPWLVAAAGEPNGADPRHVLEQAVACLRKDQLALDGV